MDVRTLATNLYSAAAGATEREFAFSGIIAAVGTFIAAALGGWDISLQLLAYMMVADYVTGILGAERIRE